MSALLGADALRGRLPAHAWRRKWVRCKSELLQRAKGPSRLCKPCTCRPTIPPIRHRPLPSASSTRFCTLNARFREKGIYPAVDPLASSSRILDPAIRWRAALCDRTGACSGRLQRYRELQDIIAILGVDELSEEDKLVVNRPAVWSGSYRSRSSWPKCLPASRAKSPR